MTTRQEKRRKAREAERQGSIDDRRNVLELKKDQINAWLKSRFGGSFY